MNCKVLSKQLGTYNVTYKVIILVHDNTNDGALLSNLKLYLIYSNGIISISDGPVTIPLSSLQMRYIRNVIESLSVQHTLRKVWMRYPVEANESAVYLSSRNQTVCFLRSDGPIDEYLGIFNVRSVRFEHVMLNSPFLAFECRC